MTRPVDVLAQAQKWIGTTEQPSGSNRVPGVTDWYGIVGPWCAMWVSRVFYDAGLPLPATTGKGFAYCPSGVAWFRNHGNWALAPIPGDVVFFQWPGSNRAEHVGIVESVNADGSVNTIEGNTNTTGSPEGLYVMRQRRKSFILGYGSPEYDDFAAPNTALIPPPPPWGFIAVDGDFGRETVRALQASLNSTGANPQLSIDGDYGPSTKLALQKRLNFTNGPIGMDGVVGGQTVRALQAHVGAPVDGAWGPGTTRKLQESLNSNRF